MHYIAIKPRRKLIARLLDWDQWITVHPHGKGVGSNGEKKKGTPVLIDDTTGEVKAGMGGKFNGRHISAVPQHGANEDVGGQMVIRAKNEGHLQERYQGNGQMGLKGKYVAKPAPDKTAKTKPARIGKTPKAKKDAPGYYDPNKARSAMTPEERAADDRLMKRNADKSYQFCQRGDLELRRYDDGFYEIWDKSGKHPVFVSISECSNDASNRGIIDGATWASAAPNPLQTQIGSKRYASLERKALKATPAARRVWDAYKNSLSYKARYDSRAFFDPRKQRSEFNPKTVETGTSIHYPCTTPFHELGHFIDFLAGGTGSMRRTASRKMQLSDSLKQEAKDRIKAIAAEAHADANDPAMPAHAFYKKWGHYPGLYPDEDMAIERINAELKEAYNKDPRIMGSVSDMFEGATLGKIKYRVGHGTGYWIGHMMSGVDGLSTEAFAEMFAAMMVGEKEEIDFIKKYFPKSWDLFEKSLPNL